MIVVVLSRIRQSLSRTVFGSSLAGDAMLVRLRSTSIALLGLVTAVGLGLVAFISQLGWPGVVNSPIPGSPAEAGSVYGAVALSQPAVAAPARRLGQASHAAGATVGSAGRAHPVSSPGADLGLGGSRQIAAPGTQSPPPVGQPPPVPVSEPTSQPVESPPASSPPAPPAAPVAAVVETPKPGASAPSTDHSTATSKPESQEPSPGKGKGGEDAKVEPSPPESPKGHGYGKDKDHPVPPPKPAGHPPGMPEDAGAAPPKAIPSPATVPPKTTAPSSDAPEASGYGAGGEAKSAGKSDGHRH